MIYLTNHCVLKWWRRINFRVWLLCCVRSKSLGTVRMGTNPALYLFYWKYLHKPHSYAINSWQFKNKPTYSSLSHVILAEYLGYTENVLKGKKIRRFTTFFVRLQLLCTTDCYKPSTDCRSVYQCFTFLVINYLQQFVLYQFFESRTILRVPLTVVFQFGFCGPNITNFQI